MSMTMEEGFKRWTAKRKSALVVEIMQGKTTVSDAIWRSTTDLKTRAFSKNEATK